MLHFVFFEVIVNKMQQSAKENCLLKRNTLPEVFPLTIGSGKTMAFENRHVGCKEREKINRRHVEKRTSVYAFDGEFRSEPKHRFCLNQRHPEPLLKILTVSEPPRTAVVPRNSDVLAGEAYQNSRPRIDKDVNS